jgi:hypothetical protein
MAVLTATFPTVMGGGTEWGAVKFLDLVASGPSRFRQGGHHHSREALPPRIAQAAAHEDRALRAGARPDRRVDEPALIGCNPALGRIGNGSLRNRRDRHKARSKARRHLNETP